MLQDSQGAHEVQGEKDCAELSETVSSRQLGVLTLSRREMGLRKARSQVTYTVSAGAEAVLESEHAGV